MTDKKVFLITGGAQGLGLFLAEKFASLGHKIIIIDRQEKENLKDFLNKFNIDYHRVDLVNKIEIEKALDVICQNNKNIEVLINNAAVRVFKPFMDFSAEEIENIITVNLTNQLFIINKLLPVMLQNNFGRIISISSISGFEGYIRGTLYCSTKGAIIRFTEALGDDLVKLNKNITANVICPDSFQTIDGEKLKSHDKIVNKIYKNILHLLTNQINGEVIPILNAKTKIREFLRQNKDLIKWFLKY
jgi:short-subunit dehydrogenase